MRGALKAVTQGDHPGRSVRDRQGDTERRHACVTVRELPAKLRLDRLHSAEASARDGADSLRVSREAAIPPSLRDRLTCRDQRELCEPVGAPDLLAREVLRRVEVAAAPEPVRDTAIPAAPAIEQYLRSDA